MGSMNPFTFVGKKMCADVSTNENYGPMRIPVPQ